MSRFIQLDTRQYRYGLCQLLNQTISLSHKTKESLLALAWREIALLRTFNS